MKSKTKPNIELFPYPGQHAQIARGRVNDHIIRVRLPKAERDIQRLGLALLGVYALMAATLAGVALGEWESDRLIRRCHVDNAPQACAEIQKRTELRK
jgi:hypothetical protein